MFCDVFSTRGFKCTANTTVFFIFCFQVSKQTNQKHWYLQCFDKTACKKTRCFRAIFHTFSAHAPPFKKRLFFTLFLPPLIRTQEGVKSGQIAKLHLNSTFCLSQSLPQSCNTKNYRRLSGASKCCKLRCFMNVPCILPAKKGPPQLKLTVLVPPERHALLHLRCGQIFSVEWQSPEISGLHLLKTEDATHGWRHCPGSIACHNTANSNLDMCTLHFCWKTSIQMF